MAPLGGLTQHWGLFNELIWPMGHYGFDPRADHERIPGRGALQKKDQITKEVLPKFFWFVFVQGNFLEPQSGFQSGFLVEF